MPRLISITIEIMEEKSVEIQTIVGEERHSRQARCAKADPKGRDAVSKLWRRGVRESAKEGRKIIADMTFKWKITSARGRCGCRGTGPF